MQATAVIGLAAALLGTAAMGTQITPGKWQSISQVTDVQMTMPEGMPPDMTDRMKTMMNSRRKPMDYCVTPDDIENAPKKLLQSSKGQCSYDKYTMANGKLDALATCRMQGGYTMQMHLAGSYTATSMDGSAVLDGKGPMGPMKITSTIHSKRIGACG
ncbi:hypothetical protein GCM10023219_11600 [Stakelama sediminis]|uniref:DUF3617 domain-containing protein n=1 Tax=Stakelama sediminis TaxID=463200 RepID=A0A840YWG4_9SPHN|nr:DUF3617 domain-containing protein [Stakelama sediminis]MBB5717884.1 hypothetical protein [Stakelama sediminis]